MFLGGTIALREPRFKLRRRDVNAAPLLARLNQLYAHSVQITVLGIGPGALLHFRQRQAERMIAIDGANIDGVLDAGGIAEADFALLRSVDLIPHIRLIFAMVALGQCLPIQPAHCVQFSYDSDRNGGLGIQRLGRNCLP